MPSEQLFLASIQKPAVSYNHRRFRSTVLPRQKGTARWQRSLIALALLIWVAPTEADCKAIDAPARHSLEVCVIDQSVLIQQSKLAANEAVRYQQVRQQAQAKFNNDSRSLDADARALESLRSSLPPAVVKARTDDIARRRIELKTRGDQINRSLSQLDSELTNSVLRTAGPLIRAVEEERGCSLLVARATLLDLVDPALDITTSVIARMNAQGAPPQGR